MVGITNNTDSKLRYVVSGSIQEKDKFENIVGRMAYFGYPPSLVFSFENRLIATYKFEDNWDKEHFRDRYNLERECMRDEARQQREMQRAMLS